jgi:hypothetical protein
LITNIEKENQNLMNNLKEFEKQLLEFRNQKEICNTDQKLVEKNTNKKTTLEPKTLRSESNVCFF